MSEVNEVRRQVRDSFHTWQNVLLQGWEGLETKDRVRHAYNYFKLLKEYEDAVKDTPYEKDERPPDTRWVSYPFLAAISGYIGYQIALLMM